MLDKLKPIEELQKVDVEIAELLRGGAEHPKKLSEIEAQIQAMRSALAAEHARLLEAEKHKRTLEDQLAQDKERVKKWEARLTEQRSTREYAALAREIDIAKKQNQTTTEEILEAAKQGEEIGSAISLKEAETQQALKSLTSEAQEIRRALETLNDGKRALEEKRAEAAKKVDPSLLRKYDVIKKRRGTVVAPIINGACKGCNMNIPPQLYNELRTSQRLDVCPSCGRMIYAIEALGAHAQP